MGEEIEKKTEVQDRLLVVSVLQFVEIKSCLSRDGSVVLPRITFFSANLSGQGKTQKGQTVNRRRGFKHWGAYWKKMNFKRLGGGWTFPFLNAENSIY
jgi:hypothetical protein